MGESRASVEDTAYYLDAVGSLHEPVDSLPAARAAVDGDDVDAGLAGAVGLLATPEVALDLDVRVGDVQAKAWHREADGAVATLATVDGIVFELAWFDAPQWGTELARVAVVPEDLDTGSSAFPSPSTCPSTWRTAPARRCAPGAPTWCRCWSPSTPAASSTARVTRSATSRSAPCCRPCTTRPAGGCGPW